MDRVRFLGNMTDLDPYDPALKYPEEWGRGERIAALKCWRDGDKTDACYWLKDHEWKIVDSVDILLTKNVSSVQMRRGAAARRFANTFWDAPPLPHRGGLSFISPAGMPVWGAAGCREPHTPTGSGASQTEPVAESSAYRPRRSSRCSRGFCSAHRSTNAYGALSQLPVLAVPRLQSCATLGKARRSGLRANPCGHPHPVFLNPKSSPDSREDDAPTHRG